MPTISKIFNTHLFEFIDDLKNIVDNHQHLEIMKKKIKKLLLINSCKPIKMWYDNCKNYDIEIERKNYIYFLRKCYKSDITDNDYLLKIFETYRDKFSNETELNKKKIMQYIYNLNKICKMYYSSKTN